jgi:hypothetical protein
MFRTAIISLFLTSTALATAEQTEITIDGEFEDWEDVPIAAKDKDGDADNQVDFRFLWLADDDRFLFLRVEASEDFDLSDDNSIILYLDTDANAATGFPIGGIGAELEWRLGSRLGAFLHEGATTDVEFADIRFRGAPTVTSKQFEMAIGRDTLPDGINPLFTGSEVRVLLKDDSSNDTIPDDGTILSYTLDQGFVPPVIPISFNRPSPTNLRVITHNVSDNKLFTPKSQPSFQRLYTAISPDIFHFQEIYENSASDAVDLIGSWLGGTWYGAQSYDCVTISRYPITGSWAIPDYSGYDGNLATLIDTTESLGTPILIINAHLPYGSNDQGRQDESDAIIAFIRRAYLLDGGGGNCPADEMPDCNGNCAPKEWVGDEICDDGSYEWNGVPIYLNCDEFDCDGGDCHDCLSLGTEVPVMITGDLNLVGFSQQLDTLLTGDIQNEFKHGPDSPPDPDGSNLTNIVSRLTEKRMGYTWRNDSNPSLYWPGKLDYLIYSDSNLAKANDFIVYTPEMSDEELSSNGLSSTDSLVSDHLIFCADFTITCNADVTSDGIVEASDLFAIINVWGLCFQCPEDLNEDAHVNVLDLLIVIDNWGPCE